jgi:ribosomal protein RSM22 (predicted rRNA methylase)
VILPEAVRAAVEERTAAVSFAELKQAAEGLSAAYRDARPVPGTWTPEVRVAAYLATRMPATYAAAAAALRPAASFPVRSLLDVGAGTGSASLAAQMYFPELATVTLIERDAAFADAAREFLPNAHILRDNFLKVASFPPHDLVIAAYSLGESMQSGLIPRLWQAAQVALVLIEPGTTRGFSLIREAREQLLASGAHLVAPCPHTGACPIAAPDWCHFAARIERSSLHRRIKNAELSYEDEKFSYLVVARGAVDLPPARIIRRPHQQPGRIELEACTPDGIQTLRVTRKDPARFRAARHAAWGDSFPL